MISLPPWVLIAFLAIPTLYWPVVAAEMFAVAMESDVWELIIPVYPIALIVIALLYWKNDYVKGMTTEEIQDEVTAGYLCVFASNFILITFICTEMFMPVLGGIFILFNFCVFHYIHSTKVLMLEVHCSYEYSKNKLQLLVAILVLSAMLVYSFFYNQHYFIVHLFATVSTCLAVLKLNAIYHDGLTVTGAKTKKKTKRM